MAVGSRIEVVVWNRTASSWEGLMAAAFIRATGGKPVAAPFAKR